MVFGKSKRWLGACALSALVVTTVPAVAATTNILFILDGSGSMWGQVDGTTKIETAKRVLGDLVRDLGPETAPGLMVYGHRSEGACDDIEVLSALGADGVETLIGKLQAIKPKGKTPIAGSLNAAKAVFTGSEGSNNNIVLISDGKETCEGDPCAAAGELAESGVGTRVHVVGFNLTDEEKAALACIADQGQGKYVTASTSDELTTAIAEVTQVAMADPEPLQPEPVPEQVAQAPAGWAEVFRDDFDGADLAEYWEVRNPDPNMFIVENGELLMVAKAVGNVEDLEAVPNIMRLNAPLPPGDWRATMTFSGELQTGVENVFMGLYGGKGDSVMARFWLSPECCYYTQANQNMDKYAGGQGTVFRSELSQGPQDAQAFGSSIPKPIAMRFIKEGRSYYSEILFAGATKEDGTPDWRVSEKATALRAPKDFVLGVSQWKDSAGEGLFLIDSLVIEEKR